MRRIRMDKTNKTDFKKVLLCYKRANRHLTERVLIAKMKYFHCCNHKSLKGVISITPNEA